MYQLSPYSKAILAAVRDRLAASGIATDADILPAVQATYPDITLEGLRPGLIELGDNWLEVAQDGSGNTDTTVTVTGIKREWSDDATAGDIAEGERDPGRE